MADKPRFSPNDTYVLDETVIKKTEKMRLTGILRDLEEDEGDLADSAGGEDSDRGASGYTIELSLDD